MKRRFSHVGGLSDETTREVAGLAGAVIFGAASLMELVRMLTLKIPWPGFTARIDWVISGLAILLWLGGAYTLARRSPKHKVLAFAGAFALLAYGLLGTMARSPFGIVYVAFAFLMPLIQWLAFRGKLTIGQRVGEPTRPPGPREIL
jgi:hypothetical protein